MLTKMRTRLIIPSSILVPGSHPSLLAFVIHEFPKEEHGMNQRAIDGRDKQNYKSIEIILNECASRCLLQLNDKIDVYGHNSQSFINEKP